MPNIIFWSKIYISTKLSKRLKKEKRTPEDFEHYKATLLRFLAGENQEVLIKKKKIHTHRHTVFSLWVDRETRILLVPFVYKGKWECQWADMVFNHKYGDAKIMQASHPKATALLNQGMEGALSISLEIEKQITQKNQPYFYQDILTLSNPQSEAIESNQQLVLGPGGAGKSCVGYLSLRARYLEMQSTQEKEWVYLTATTGLAEELERTWCETGLGGVEKPNKRVYFCTYFQWVQWQTNRPAEQFENYENFLTWYNEIFLALSPKKNKKNNQALPPIAKQLELIYESIAKKEIESQGIWVGTSSLSTEEGQYVSKVLSAYKNYLDKANKICLDWTILPPHSVDFLVIDEAQKLTDAVIAQIFHVKRDAICIMDDNQSIGTENAHRSFAQNVINHYRALSHLPFQKPSVLPTSFRCNTFVSEIATAVLQAQCTLTQGKADKYRNSAITSNHKTTSGGVHWIELGTEDYTSLRNREKGSNFAVIILDEKDRKTAENLYQTDFIYTIEEALGHGYENVILDRFISENEQFHRIGQQWAKNYNEGKVIQHQSKTKKQPLSKEENEDQRWFRRLYTAILRAKFNLYIVISPFKKPNPLLGYFKKHSKNIISEAPKEINWEIEVINLLTRKEIEKAKKTAYDKLKIISAEKWNEFLKNHGFDEYISEDIKIAFEKLSHDFSLNNLQSLLTLLPPDNDLGYLTEHPFNTDANLMTALFANCGRLLKQIISKPEGIDISLRIIKNYFSEKLKIKLNDDFFNSRLNKNEKQTVFLFLIHQEKGEELFKTLKTHFPSLKLISKNDFENLFHNIVLYKKYQILFYFLQEKIYSDAITPEIILKRINENDEINPFIIMLLKSPKILFELLLKNIDAYKGLSIKDFSCDNKAGIKMLKAATLTNQHLKEDYRDNKNNYFLLLSRLFMQKNSFLECFDKSDIFDETDDIDERLENLEFFFHESDFVDQFYNEENQGLSEFLDDPFIINFLIKKHNNLEVWEHCQNNVTLNYWLKKHLCSFDFAESNLLNSFLIFHQQFLIYLIKIRSIDANLLFLPDNHMRTPYETLISWKENKNLVERKDPKANLFNEVKGIIPDLEDEWNEHLVNLREIKADVLTVLNGSKQIPEIYDPMFWQTLFRSDQENCFFDQIFEHHLERFMECYSSTILSFPDSLVEKYIKESEREMNTRYSFLFTLLIYKNQTTKLLEILNRDGVELLVSTCRADPLLDRHFFKMARTNEIYYEIFKKYSFINDLLKTCKTAPSEFGKCFNEFNYIKTLLLNYDPIEDFFPILAMIRQEKDFDSLFTLLKLIPDFKTKFNNYLTSGPSTATLLTTMGIYTSTSPNSDDGSISNCRKGFN